MKQHLCLWTTMLLLPTLNFTRISSFSQASRSMNRVSMVFLRQAFRWEFWSPAQTWKRTITGKLREFNPRIAIHRQTPDLVSELSQKKPVFGCRSVGVRQKSVTFFLQQASFEEALPAKGSLVIVQGLIIKGKFLQVAARCFDQNKSEMSRFLRIKSEVACWSLLFMCLCSF